MKYDRGIVQLWSVSPNGGTATQVTHNPWDVQSAFSWTPDGQRLAYIVDNSVFVTEVATGQSYRLTPRTPDAASPTAYACVVSPDGHKIAYTCNIPAGRGSFDQIVVIDIPRELSSR